MMSRRKQVLFYCLMVVMTLAVIEGMAQAAYYIAYGEFNGAGPAPATAGAAEAAADPDPDTRTYWLQHPYYGYTRPEAEHLMNQTPPPRREDGVLLIGLVGGSVALDVAGAFRSALETWRRANDLPLRPVVLELAYYGISQPQQVMQIANTLALGGEYDIIVNLDGFNDLVVPHENYQERGIAPFYPTRWQLQPGFTEAQALLVGRIAVLRLRQQRLNAIAGARPWRWSALYGITNRFLAERIRGQIRALNHELVNIASGEHNLRRHGPIWPAESDDAVAPDPDDLTRIALRVWYLSSVLLSELSRAADAEYYHFLQPNQYVPDAKPFSAAELAVAYDADEDRVGIYRSAYPLWPRLGAELRQQGINYHDLTQIFADNRETLYIDDCCHLNAQGNELLAASMVQHLEPALRQHADRSRAERAAADGTALAAALRESSPIHAVNKLYFDVQLTAADTLSYSRDDCRPGDTVAPFAVQIMPVAAADLRPGDADSGYNRYEFSF